MPTSRSRPSLQTSPSPTRKVRAAEPRLRAEAGKARRLSRLHAAEEGGEGLVEPAQDLLLGAVAVSGQLRNRVPDGLQLAGLPDVAEADALPAPRLDALLEARVVEVAEVSEHVRQGRFLRPVGVEPVLVAPDQPSAHVRHVFHLCRAGRHCKGRAFT